MSDKAGEPSRKTEVVDEDRRAFLNTYGKAALVAPPVITAMLATSMSSPAIAASTGGGGGGRGGGDTGLAFLGAGAGAVPLAAAGGKKAPPVQQPVLGPAPVNVQAAPLQSFPPVPPPPVPGPERG